MPEPYQASGRTGPLTQRERSEIQKCFAGILGEMKMHGLPDVGLLNRAYRLAVTAGGNRRDEAGNPRVLHPLQVAKIIADCGHESDMVAAALLHEVVEHGGVTKKELEAEFGIPIADIVDTLTNVNELLAPEESISERDLGVLSDVKFLTKSVEVQKAVYIKCADRIHTLRMSRHLPEEERLAKARHTRTIIIPKARELHIHHLVDILRDLCLKIEDPQGYQELEEAYHRILRQNRDSLYGSAGLLEETRRMILEDGLLGKSVAEVVFRERSIDCFREELAGQMANGYQVRESFTKDAVPLFDLYFISDDCYAEGPEHLFFAFYEKLHRSRFRFTIVGLRRDSYESWYLLKDRYDNQYRLFLQSQTEHLEYTHGLIVSAKLNDFRSGAGYVNPAEPGSPRRARITVFKKDGEPLMIDEGATVLDFAFAIDPNIGICARYAHLNGSTAQTPIYTRLRQGDMVEVVADHHRENPGRDIPHATVRWFEYLHTREATRALSRWLEKHMDSATPTMLVYDENGREYEIEMASTILDFAFAVDEEIGLHVKNAYLNLSHTPEELDRTLRYGDRVRFETDPEDPSLPVFNWLSIVRTKKAKNCLIRWFDQRFRSK